MSFRLVGAFVLALTASMAAAPAIAAAAQCPSNVDVRNIMTVTQYDRAGLNKLDKKQLEALNAWLAQYIRKYCSQPRNPEPAAQQQAAASGNAAKPAAATPPVNRAQTPTNTQPAAPTNSGAASFGAPPKTETEKPGQIESRIVGEFYGWTGNTTFTLENGQVWKQAGPGYFRIALKNPKVTIKKLLIGYVLKLNGYGREVFVRRVQ